MVVNKKIIALLFMLLGFESQIMACCWSNNDEQDYSTRVTYAVLVAHKKLLSAYNSNPAMQAVEVRDKVQGATEEIIKSNDFIESMRQDAQTKAFKADSRLALFAIKPHVFDPAECLDTDLNDIISFLQPAPEALKSLSSTEERQLKSARQAFMGAKHLPDFEAKIRDLDSKDTTLSRFALRLPCFERHDQF